MKDIKEKHEKRKISIDREETFRSRNVLRGVRKKRSRFWTMGPKQTRDFVCFSIYRTYIYGMNYYVLQVLAQTVPKPFVSLT